MIETSVEKYFNSTNNLLLVEMTATADEQGRLYLPKDLRERHGDKYHVVEYEDRVELIPVADDPLEAVRDAAGELDEASTSDVLEAARKRAETDVREDLSE